MSDISLYQSLKDSKVKGETTRKLVSLITSRLSGRDDIKSEHYEIIFRENTVSFQPNVKVYPDRRRRKPTDSKPVLEFIMMKYFGEIIEGVDGETIYVKPDTFVNEGHYMYVLSADRKHRKWISVR